MNKPATKEPSMDEILSSIRQIIADDDAAGVPRRPALQASAPDPMAATPATGASFGGGLSDMLDEMEPLALSSSQILADMDGGASAMEPLSFDSLLAGADEEEAADSNSGPIDFSSLVVPDDIGFDPEPDTTMLLEPEPEPEPEPVFSPPSRQQRTVEQASPMPDPTLSRDLTERLIEPATNAAVRSTFSKLSNLGLGNQGATIESMMRDMLRPMLKEWLDENLPSVVERMVEKEISRISRGVE